MRRARAGFLLSSSLAVALTTSLSAVAQPQEPGPSRSSTQFTLRREEAGGIDAQTARSRARAGDCAGALAPFDAAIKSTVEPSLRRDRGLCHEKLDHPYPAIDDFRAYLTARPDAADAEQIRQRLDALEARVRRAKSSDEPPSDDESSAEETKESGATGSARFSVGGGRASASASGRAADGDDDEKQDDGAGGEAKGDYDDLVAREQLVDSAQASPLRYGKGFVLGPFVHIPRFFIGEGAREALSYGVGGTFRYSTGPSFTIVSELGYAGIGTSGASSSLAGPLLFGGVELRLPLNRFAGDQLLLRGGLGYERYVVSGTRAVNNTLLGRVAFGFRHVFGPAMGVEFLVDGGPAYFIPAVGNNRFNVVVGGSFAFVVGF